MNKTKEYEKTYLGVLDGIRSLSILLIVWFHFWQQSWLFPTVCGVSLDYLPRFGFLFVDLLILLSSFCLFLPYARSMVFKEKMPKTKDFYIKRIARIIPSYYLALIISVIFLLIDNKFIFSNFFIRDTISHFLFFQNWSYETLFSQNYIGVLWTVAVLVQFYLVFPFIAKRFTKNPIITYISLLIIGLLCTYFISINVTDYNLPYYVNHIFTFIPVFANGMLAAWFYNIYIKLNKRKKAMEIIFTIISLLTIVLYFVICQGLYDENIQLWQINNRFILSILFMIFIICTLLSSKIYQKIFANKVTKFIAGISFNLYIYHQFISVKLKEFHIPYYLGDIPPNYYWDNKWQWNYFIICIIVSLVVAIIMTYLIERPASRYIKKHFK